MAIRNMQFVEGCIVQRADLLVVAFFILLVAASVAGIFLIPHP
jgi:hypothetical protein